MNKQQGMAIVEGLRSAQAAGAPVVELLGEDARNFAFVKDKASRKELLGSFSVEAGKQFFVSIVSSPSNDDDYGFAVFEKFGGALVFASNLADSAGVVWKYQPAKQRGNNQARKQAFFEAAKSESITIPIPGQDISAFSAAVARAIDLRRLADSAGGGDGDEEAPSDEPSAGDLLARLFTADPERRAAARLLAASIRFAHAISPKSWCVTNPVGRELIRLNVGNLRVLDLLPGQVMIVIDPAKISAGLIESLGDAWKLEPDEVRYPYGRILMPPSVAAALPEEVPHAHEAYVARAATMTSPYARFHQPTIIEQVEAILGEQLPAPAAPQTRYWKIAPGESAEQWDAWRSGGYIAIGWNQLGDLTEVTRDEFERRAAEKKASRQVWKFRTIEVGDRVVANDGFFRVLGIGTVTGPYRFVKGALYAHQMPVRWDDTHERRVEMRGWRSTLIRLNHDDFTQIESAPLATSEPVPGAGLNKGNQKAVPERGIDFVDLLSRLASESLSFSAELVASYLLALQAKRFVLLTGISGTGKTQLAREIARGFGQASGSQAAPSADDRTYELIAVRPDWTDARALLGFYNPLTKSYVSTPILQLLLRADAEVTASSAAAPPRPFFLIFDEMNLARVEHYFSDFLSAMESGEAIHLHDDPQVEEEEDIPRRISIPRNVFVIGTVNVDETTYMFSPKVLDRAFVLELNDVDLKGLAGPIQAEAAESTPLQLVNLEGGLELRGPATDAEWQRFERALDGEASALLHKLHAALAIENRHFGYRVAKEIARFVDLAIEQTDGSAAAQRAALDVAVLAKILPKLHGSQAEVEQTLKRLMAIAIGDRAEAEVFAEDGAPVAGVEVPLPRTARKLRRMLRRLRAHGFVSFIE